MIRPLLILTLLLGLVLPVQVQAQDLANRLFGAHVLAAPGPARSFGSYARGCGQGFVQLPETGPHWQAMRTAHGR